MNNQFRVNILRAVCVVICSGSLLSGCAAAPRDPERPGADLRAQSAPAAGTDTPANRPAELPAPVTAGQERLYKALVAELAGFGGHYTLSTEYFYQVAAELRDPALAERATQMALYAKDDAAILKSAQLWLDLEADNLEAREILIAMLLRQDRGEDALRHLDALLDELPADSERPLNLLGKLLRPGEDKQAAVKVMGRIAEKRKQDPGILLAYAYLLKDAKEYEQSRAVLEQVFRMQPGHPDAVPLYLDVLRKQDKNQDALDWLEKLVRDNPRNREWRNLYARMLLSAERHPQAIAQFKQLLAQSPEDVDALYALGLLSLQAKQYAQAERYFLRLVKIGEQRDAAYYFLGQIAEQEKSAKRATEWYQKVEKGPHYLGAQTRIAMLLVQQGEVEQGLKHLRQIETDSDEEEFDLLLFQAEVLIKQKRYDEAMDLYGRGLQADPDNIDLLYSQGLLAEKVDRLDQLEKNMRRILELEPDNVEALNALGYTLADKTDRHAEAYELIKQAYAQRPEAFYVLDSMGWVLYRLGRYSESLEYLQRAYETEKDPEVAAHLGEVLWRNGRQAEAEEIWKEALLEFPEDEKLRETIQRFRGMPQMRKTGQ